MRKNRPARACRRMPPVVKVCGGMEMMATQPRMRNPETMRTYFHGEGTGTIMRMMPMAMSPVALRGIGESSGCWLESRFSAMMIRAASRKGR